jgi:hypothetical protein
MNFGISEARILEGVVKTFHGSIEMRRGNSAISDSTTERKKNLQRKHCRL